MAEFFKGWRRKMGCLTLAMACAFLAASLRDSTNSRMIIREPIDRNDSRHQQIVEVSLSGIIWESYDFPFRSGDYGQGCKSPSDVRFYRQVTWGRKRIHVWYFFGFEFGEYAVASDLWFRRSYAMIPSQTIAFVLSLVSAGMLLGAPPGNCSGARRTKPDP